MLAPLPFALHASAGCPAHAELALSLAWAFRDLESAPVEARLDELAAAMPEPASGSPLDQLSALAGLCASPEWCRVAVRPDPDALLLDSVLATGVGHPLALAVVATEVAARRGIPVGIVSNGSDHRCAHTHLPEPLVLRADDGEIEDARGLPPTLTWRCSHESCGLLIDELEAEWMRHGRLDQALLSAELRMHLPFNDSGAKIARRRLDRLRARFN
jgi:Transglutaminase-like superfamily